MPFVRSVANLPTGTTLESLSFTMLAALPPAATVTTVPRAEYPNYNPNDTLARIIVDAWLDAGFKNELMANPDQVLRQRGLFLVNPRVMTHAQFESDLIPENAVVLVLPDAPPNLPAGANLLDSARAAMAHTPVGI